MWARTAAWTTARPNGIPGRGPGHGADDTVGHDGLLGIDVAQKGVQCSRALSQARGQVCPFVRGDEPRHQIEREHLGATLPTDPERDVLGALILFDTALAGAQHGHPESATDRKIFS